MRRVLKLPAYRHLLSAYVLNELAWLVGSLTLALLVYRHTGSALGATVFFLCSQFVPALLSPWVVARVDQSSGVRVLAALYGLQCVAFAALGSLAGSHFVLAPLLAIIVCGGTAAVSSRSLVRALTVGVTSPAGLLREGNALANMAFSVCFMAGPVLGGVVVLAGGTQAVLFADAVLFAAFAAITAMLLGDRHFPEPAPDRRSRPRTRVRAAVAHARERPTVLSLLALQAVALLFFTISIPVEVVFAEHTLHAGPSGYGGLLSCWGAGALIGSAAFARWGGLGPRELIAIGAGALGAGFVLMAVAPWLALALAGAAVAGFGNGIHAVASRTALQEQVDQRWMAMTMSLNESIYQSIPGAGMLIGGAITALAGTRVAFAVAGIGAFLVSAAVWVVLRPSGGVPPRSEPAPPGAPGAPGAPVEASDLYR